MSKYPSNWSQGSTVDGRGFPAVWIGREPATEENIAELEEAFPGAEFDLLSVCGLYGYDWNSEWNIAAGYPRMGGVDTPVYQNQNVDPDAAEDVQFIDKVINYVDEDGNGQAGIPPDCGAFHVKGGVCYSGPKPNSAASKALGNGYYAFNGNKGKELYVIKNA